MPSTAGSSRGSRKVPCPLRREPDRPQFVVREGSLTRPLGNGCGPAATFDQRRHEIAAGGVPRQQGPQRAESTRSLRTGPRWSAISSSTRLYWLREMTATGKPSQCASVRNFRSASRWLTVRSLSPSRSKYSALIACRVSGLGGRCLLTLSLLHGARIGASLGLAQRLGRKAHALPPSSTACHAQASRQSRPRPLGQARTKRQLSRLALEPEPER